jgi:hypothetical protein
MTDGNCVWMKPPFGMGDPKEVEATPEILTPLMIAGWSQCDPPQRGPGGKDQCPRLGCRNC